MTGEDPEDVVFGGFEFNGDVEIEGDPAEIESDVEERLEYLESVWPSIDETDPQRQVVALEIVTLRNVAEEIEESV